MQIIKGTGNLLIQIIPNVKSLVCSNLDALHVLLVIATSLTMLIMLLLFWLVATTDNAYMHHACNKIDR